jgi:hypothetical protein
LTKTRTCFFADSRPLAVIKRFQALIDEFTFLPTWHNRSAGRNKKSPFEGDCLDNGERTEFVTFSIF